MIERKKIYIYSFITIILTVLSILMLTKVSNRKSNIDIEQNGTINYKVSLFDSEYDIGNANKYITSMVDDLYFEFDYNLLIKENKDYKVKYRIEANMYIKDDDITEVLYNQKYELIKEKEELIKSNSKFNINESVNVDFDTINMDASNFINSYDLRDSNASLEVSLYVNVDGLDILKDEQVLYASIPLNTKTTGINIIDNTDQVFNSNNSSNTFKYYMLFVLFILLDIYVIYRFAIYLYSHKNSSQFYDYESNRIIRDYANFIQEINESIEELYKNNKECVLYFLNSFVDLLEIRDNLTSPILMFRKENRIELSVVDLKNNAIYVYILERKEK